MMRVKRLLKYLVKEVERSFYGNSCLTSECSEKGDNLKKRFFLLRAEDEAERNLLINLLEKKGYIAFVVNADTLKDEMEEQRRILGRYGELGFAMPCILQGKTQWFVGKTSR